ncbi:MAG: cupredoxin domain-containing protein [Bacteroidia bacterium]
MKKSSIVVIISICCLFGCKKQDPGTPGPNEIFLEYKTFSPTQLEIIKGTTVTFTNKDNANHSATSTTKLFDSGKISSDNSFTHTFNDVGVFYFYCKYHSSNPQEQGAIMVK